MSSAGCGLPLWSRNGISVSLSRVLPGLCFLMLWIRGMRHRLLFAQSVILLRREPIRIVGLLRGLSWRLEEVDNLRSQVRRQRRLNLLHCRRTVGFLLRIHILNRTGWLLYLMRHILLRIIRRQGLKTPTPLAHILLLTHTTTNSNINGAGIIDHTLLNRRAQAAPRVVRSVGFLSLLLRRRSMASASASKHSNMGTRSVPMLIITGDRWRNRP